MSQRYELLSKSLLIGAVLISTVGAWAQENAAQGGVARSTGKLPRVTILQEHAGPFVIGGKQFTFRTQLKRITHEHNEPGRPREEYEDAADWVRIEDAHGNAVWEERYSVQVTEYGFADSVTAGARKLIGDSGEGLMLNFDELPSAPPAGGSLLIFAMKNGELTKCGEPLFIYGQMEEPPSAGQDASRLFPGDVLKLDEWTGSFGVVREYRVDLKGCAVELACKSQCSYLATGEQLPVEQEAEVRLYARPSESAASKLVKVRAGTVVERIQAYEERPGNIEENPQGEQYGPWLKVCLGRVEGWVRDWQELAKLGMPQAG